MKTVKIKSIKKIPPQNGYDLEIVGNHNFYANGILAHNCRGIATKEGLYTRKGEKYMTVPHIEDALKGFFAVYPDAVLDGELMGDGLKDKLNETMKLIRRSVHITPEHLKNSEQRVRFFVYDGYNIGNVTKESIYMSRYARISIELETTPYIKLVQNVMCNNLEDIYKHFGKLVEDGEEGSIISVLNAPYENKRSANLLKMKQTDDSEAEILDIKEGTGNWAGMGKVITLKWNGKEFDASFKGTQEEAKKFLDDKDQWIGKTVTFLYNNLTGLGVPNFSRVDYNNCLK